MEERWRWLPFLLLVALALPDLLAPPTSPTILRQTQTYAQTVGLLAAGFSPAGLTIPINGPEPFRVVYEFPLYQGLVAVLFAVFGPAYFWGKAVSLAAALGALAVFQRLVRARWGAAVAWRAGLIFAGSPIALLLATAFQPDALALLLALLAAAGLERWRAAPGPRPWLALLAALLGAALAKFTLLVPLAPVLAAGLWTRRPAARELALGVGLVLIPFAGWLVWRGQLMDPAYLAVDARDFFFGDPGRFLRAGYYLKPAFILGAMVACGAGVVLLAVGLHRAGRVEWLLLAGVPLYFVLIPTAAEQTYYAYALVPALAVVMARGALTLEAGGRRGRRVAIVAAWIVGWMVAGPYTLRLDRVTPAAAAAVRAASRPEEFVFVVNAHDRGVGIGAFNPALLTLAERRGWNVDFRGPDAAEIGRQIEARRAAGVRWAVVTWWTPALDPWFTPLWPAQFSRVPQFAGRPVDGAALAAELARTYPVRAHGANWRVLEVR